MKLSITDQKIYNAVVLSRFDAETVPASLRQRLTAFRTAHVAFKTALTNHDKATDARQVVANKIDAAHEAVRGAIEPLADALVGAKTGTRAQPFRGVCALSPSRIRGLGAAQIVRTSRDIAKKIRKAKPKGALKSSVDKLSNAAEALAKLLGALTAPSTAEKRARKARDKARASVEKTLAALKAAAASEWIEDKELYASMFAPPDQEQAPKPKKSKKGGKKGSKGTGGKPPKGAKGTGDPKDASANGKDGANGTTNPTTTADSPAAAKPVDGAPPVEEAEKVADFVKQQSEGEDASEAETDDA
jgi:hypothetical protein